MRLTFFGSSHGVPEPDRKCTSMLLQVGEICYFVDMGTPAVDELTKRGISTDRVKAVFVTHMHGDHTNGLIPFVDLLSWYYKTSDPQIFLPQLEGVSHLESWISANGTQLRPEIGFQKIKEGTFYDDGVLKATAVRTQHTDASFAFWIQAEGKNLLFTGDLAGPQKDFPQVAFNQKMDLIVCEGAHFPVTDYLPFFERCKAGQYCITHYAPWNFPNMLKLREALPQEKISFATDGFEMEL